MAEDYTFLLRAYCATYNHVHFIIDALNGFGIQKAVFYTISRKFGLW